MTGIKDYSPVPASNTALFPEGMAPSAVNDGMRQVQADIRAEVASKAADIASAAAVDLGAATGDFIDITGTATITSFGTVSAGIRRTVRFTGALTLTHNATSLILPGGANIITADGDIARFRSLGAGNWVCEGYSRASGAAVDDSNYAKLDADNTFTSTDAGATGPTLSLHHDSASPAVDDVVGAVNFKGNNDADEEVTYANVWGQIVDTTDGSEDGRGILQAMKAGTLTAVLNWAQGVWGQGVTGDDPGAGKINMSGYEVNGTALPFQKFYESSLQNIVSAGFLRLPHGLGVQPKLYMIVLQCLVANQGYQVGDEASIMNLQGTHQGATIVPTATNLDIWFGQSAAVFNIINRSNGTAVSATNSDWRLIARAWA